MTHATSDAKQTTPPNRPVRLCVAILAAGASERFNGIKALAPMGHATMLGHVKGLTDLQPHRNVFAVIGAHWQQLLPELSKLGLPFVFNSDWQSGQRSSVAIAASSIPADAHGLLILTVDQIALCASSLRRLIEAFEASPERITCAAYSDTVGVPAIFPRSELSALSDRAPDADHGAQHRLLKAPNVVAIDMPEAALDVDRRDELAAFIRARAPHNARN